VPALTRGMAARDEELDAVRQYDFPTVLFSLCSVRRSGPRAS
jgi:hypothetical protein